MSSINFINKIIQSKKKLFTFTDLATLLEVRSTRTLEDFLRRLINERVLVKLEKGKYLLSSAMVSDFEIAQFLYSPSYISFEMALNYHGILGQFPMEITSATTKRTISKKVGGKLYSYSSLSKKMFIGYFKEDNSLIALPEKAVFDQFYMISKGIKTAQYLDEMDFSNVKKDKVGQYTQLVTEKLRRNISNLIEEFL